MHCPNRREEGDTHLLVPSQKNAPANVTPTWQCHALVQILHQGILRVLRQRSDDPRDLSGFRAVQNSDQGLEVEVLHVAGEQVSTTARVIADKGVMHTFASSTFGPYGASSSTKVKAPGISPLQQRVSLQSQRYRGDANALGQRAADGSCFLLRVIEDLGWITGIWLVELAVYEHVLVVLVDVNLAKVGVHGRGQAQSR